ncbi:hypothetical protein LSUE1_G006200, partial [Lachnellula suecica]
MVVPLKETEGGKIVSVVLSLVSMSLLAVCLSRRVQNVRDWSRLPLVCWLVLLIYSDSVIFVFGTAIISNGFGVDSSKDMCSKAILLCLGCYLTTKFLYYFLVERVYIIRRTSKPRSKDWLYLFNSCGMLLPYCVVIVLNFLFRFSIYEDGTCRIGMKRIAMIPLIAFDIVVNGCTPTKTIAHHKSEPSPSEPLSAAAAPSSPAPLVMVLHGEPGWICLMCCNIDILFSVLVLHWITSKDNASTLSTSNAANNNIYAASPRRFSKPIPRPDVGLAEYTKRGGVTTLVTAK